MGGLEVVEGGVEGVDLVSLQQRHERGRHDGDGSAEGRWGSMRTSYYTFVFVKLFS